MKRIWFWNWLVAIVAAGLSQWTIHLQRQAIEAYRATRDEWSATGTRIAKECADQLNRSTAALRQLDDEIGACQRKLYLCSACDDWSVAVTPSRVREHADGDLELVPGNMVAP